MPDNRNLMLQLAGRQGLIAGQTFSMETAEITLGRAPDNTISIPDPKISRYHARLRQTPQGWLVEDLGSSNGTFINEQRLTGSTWLQPGDTLRLGDNVIFSAEVAPEAESTQVSRRYSGAPPPPPPYGSPPPPPPPSGGRRFPWLLIPLGGLLLLLLLIAGIAAYFLLLAPKSISRPTVTLQPPPGVTEVAVGEPALLTGQARDPKLITRGELWADGKLVNVTAASTSAGTNPLIFSPVWTPDTAGAHALFARAYTADGRMGQSSILYLNAREIAEGPVLLEQPITTTMTITDLAQATGNSVDSLIELNPGLDAAEPLPTDESVIIPAPTGTEEAAAEETATPTVTPTPEGGGVGPATEEGLTTPTGLSATDIGCKIHLTWNDAEHESGYRIFSRPPGGLVYTQIAELEANTTSYDFDVTTPGSWGVYIIAFTSEAELASSPVEVTIAAGPTCSAPPGTELVFNALAMEAPLSYDHVYCFASMANGPYERVPTDDGVFVNRGVADALNITDHLAGAQARQFNWPGAAPLPVKFECWGWAGADLHLLGNFENNHPAEEWDGRELSGSGDNFTLHYSINRVPEGGAPPVLDPTMPVPENVHLNPNWMQCMATVFRGSPSPNLAACIGNSSIAWDWPSPYDTGLIQGWRIYMRHWYPGTPGPITESILTEVDQPPSRGAFIPPPPLGCGEAVEYRVSAFSYGRESAKSATAVGFINAPCPVQPMVTWETVATHSLHDHIFDNELEGYGYLGVHGVWKSWNAPTGPFTAVDPHTTYNWSDMTIDGSHHNNVAVASVAEMENLHLAFYLYDHDLGPDEAWCIGSMDLPGRTYAQWAATNETHTIDGSGPKGSCSVNVRINGISLPPAAVVVPKDLSVSMLPTLSATGAPQFRLMNLSTEFMLNEAVTIHSAYNRSRTVGPTTETESHSYPAQTIHVTIPAHTSIVIPAGFTVEDGWTTLVNMVAVPVSFPDPNPANNGAIITFHLE